MYPHKINIYLIVGSMHKYPPRRKITDRNTIAQIGTAEELLRLIRSTLGRSRETYVLKMIFSCYYL